MHRHGKVVPSFCRGSVRSRAASTAVKRKVDVDLGKWTKPSTGALDGTKWATRPSSIGAGASGRPQNPSSFPSPSSSTRRTPQRSWSTPSPPNYSATGQGVIDKKDLFRDVAPHVGVSEKAAPKQRLLPDVSAERQSAWSGSRTAGKWGRTAQDSLLRPVQNMRRTTAPDQRQSTSKAQEQNSQRRQDTLVGNAIENESLYEEDTRLGSSSASKFHRDRRHKGRGSIVQMLEDMPHLSQSDGYTGSRRLAQTKAKAKAKKTSVEKKIRADVYIPSVVSVGALAQLLGVRLERLQQRMKRSGMADETSYDHVLTSDYAILLAEEFGRNPIVSDELAFDIHPSPPHPNPTALPHRPPVVTIMGHVDHGKTTLLDTLRSASVAKGEAGGITQHIGAFSVPVAANTGSTGGPRSITFLDTPGHAAFSAMRARGAGTTDIVVLVVAADDGIMPQTREVIELIKKEQDNVGVVVAINKVDKPGVDVEAVQKSLLAEGIQLEAFGGDVPSVAVSGLNGQGLSEFVETLSAIAEMQDLRAETDGPVHGYILESKMHKGLGAVATVLVRRGSLTVGSHIISGTSQAKVRVMNDSSGKSVKSASPGMAVTVSGWKTLPNAGDDVLQGSESDIKKAIANRQRKAELEASLVDVEAINASRREERERRELEAEGIAMEKEENTGPKELKLVVKADVSGSAEAVTGALQGMGNHLATTKVIYSGVGDVTESDVTLAKTAGGMIVAFNVQVPRAMEVLAAQDSVSISSSGIIYRLIEQVKEHVIKLLPSVIEKTVTGEADVLQIFEIQLRSKQTTKVAGCRVTNGLVERSKQARVIRKGEVMHEGPVETLRQVKKDVTEVRKGSECGLNLVGFSDLREGDTIQMFSAVEKPGTL
ncbi:translation initiation factor IF-2 [Marasmius crinis-equi]|uniref:Translation initiation factor IF-2, mitochondrial n=1 Tax=Marasmius crinis-equi TaxID=585013 RepID=A0ABR3FSG3_9AGAR